jgi:uncharacterized protein (UPF0548 family)
MMLVCLEFAGLQMESIISRRHMDTDGGLNRERFQQWMDAITDWRMQGEKFGVRITKLDRKQTPVQQARVLHKVQVLRPHRRHAKADALFDDSDMPDVVVV